MLSIEWLREQLHYNHETGRIDWIKRGMGRRMGKEVGCFDAHGYRRIMLQRKPYGGHVIAWALHHGEWPSKYIDHINGDRADNRASNLRLATASQNVANSRLSRHNTSGLKGVCWNKKSHKWQATIRVMGRNTYLGLHQSPQEAHMAYVAAAKQHFGEFARVG